VSQPENQKNNIFYKIYTNQKSGPGTCEKEPKRVNTFWTRPYLWYGYYKVNSSSEAAVVRTAQRRQNRPNRYPKTEEKKHMGWNWNIPAVIYQSYTRSGLLFTKHSISTLCQVNQNQDHTRRFTSTVHNKVKLIYPFKTQKSQSQTFHNKITTNPSIVPLTLKLSHSIEISLSLNSVHILLVAAAAFLPVLSQAESLYNIDTDCDQSLISLGPHRIGQLRALHKISLR